jgi:hypothetical protein
MKYVAILILAIGFSSCYWWQNDWYNTYMVKNQSYHNIEIITFQSNSSQNGVIEIDSISTKIGKDSTYIAYQNRGEDHSSKDDAMIFSSTTDSCRIIFDGERQKVYYRCKLIEDCDTLAKNILLLDYSYSESCPRKVGCDYTYTITEEDYRNAEPIE